MSITFPGYIFVFYKLHVLRVSGKPAGNILNSYNDTDVKVQQDPAAC